MSKAFTRESDDSGREDRPPIRAQLPGGVRNYITAEGARRFREELERLLEARRAGPAAGDDLEAQAGRSRLDAAIRRLQSILDSAVISEPPPDPGKIAFGARVRVRYSDGDEEEFQIVGVDEADPGQGRISWISPLARALLGLKAGNTARFRSPAGEQGIEILDVRYGVEGSNARQ